MEKHIAQTRRFFQIPLYLLMPGLALLALIGGSYVGHECEIICDRAEDSCRITSAGYLFYRNDILAIKFVPLASVFLFFIGFLLKILGTKSGS
ncbi:MAG: hypothetical protein V4732_11570 [Pseudomonadota bacterium]